MRTALRLSGLPTGQTLSSFDFGFQPGNATRCCCRDRPGWAGPTADIMNDLSSRHGSNKNRYFFTEKHGWVDVRHFGAAAANAFRLGETAAKVLGFGLEVDQALREGEEDYQSAFSPEDLPSNAAGADFGANYLDSKLGATAAFDMWLNDAGGLPQDDPRAGREALPDQDPSLPENPEAHKRASKTDSEPEQPEKKEKE